MPVGVVVVVWMPRVALPDIVTLDGLIVTVPRLGDADTAKLTVPLKPPIEVTVMVLEPKLPCTIVTVVGFAVSAKSWTLTVTVVEWLSEPLMPVTVTVYVPAVLLVQLRVEVPEPPVMLVGVKVQVRPLGVTV